MRARVRAKVEWRVVRVRVSSGERRTVQCGVAVAVAVVVAVRWRCGGGGGAVAVRTRRAASASSSRLSKALTAAVA